MKIYTKAGDQGQTSLWGGKRVAKNHLRIQAYGTLDEANAHLGVAMGLISSKTQELVPDLRRIQNQLFDLGSELATPSEYPAGLKLIHSLHVTELEKLIDRYDQKLKPLKQFILPGGTALAGQLHVVRTVVRRAERELVALMEVDSVRSEVLMYLNRLSDYFFTLARFVNFLEGVTEQEWTKEVSPI